LGKNSRLENIASCVYLSKEVIAMEENAISVSRIFKLESDSKLKAFADVSFSGMVIKGFSVVDGEKGLFVSMPRHQGKDGKWYETVTPSTKELKQQLTQAVLEAYQS
jgi:DNA-binding cell septation regulator SpoVG